MGEGEGRLESGFVVTEKLEEGGEGEVELLTREKEIEEREMHRLFWTRSIEDLFRMADEFGRTCDSVNLKTLSDESKVLVVKKNGELK